jgi:REP element-mobilizing transposase RayT/DNA-binding transcriptional ArsR family regulator
MRGIERRPIFFDDWDRDDFVTRLDRLVVECDATCLAFALMTNHVHLALRSGARPLAEVMSRVNTGYARRFNLRHLRSGHLFENRYGSLLVDDDAYLRRLVRYVHLNPLRAGLVSSLEALAHYPWTGHAALMGEARPFQAVDEVLRWFAPDPELARKRLVAWMREGLVEGRDAPERSRPDGVPPAVRRGAVLLPEPSFRPAVTALAEPMPSPLRRRALGWTLDRLIEWLCAETGANPAQLRNGARTRVETRARAAIGHLATRELDCSVLEVSRATGVSHGAMSRSLRRGGSIVSELGLALPPSPPR